MKTDKKQVLRKGRPRKHFNDDEKRAANAVSAAAYRLRQKAKKQARRDMTKVLKSDIINLSAMAPSWRRPPASR